jgi:hypothetical protein
MSCSYFAFAFISICPSPLLSLSLSVAVANQYTRNSRSSVKSNEIMKQGQRAHVAAHLLQLKESKKFGINLT